MKFIWKILDIETLKDSYFTKLSELIRAYGFNNDTIRHKWSKAKKEHPQNNELEIFIIVDKYKITKEKVN